MKKILLIFTLLLFINCKKQDDNIKSGEKLNIVSDKELLNGWKIFSNDSIKINTPKDWNPQQVEDVLFYVPLDKNKANLYFTILKTNISIADSNKYIKEIFRQIAEKDKDFSYLLTKVTFENGKICYKLDLFTTEKNIKYKIYCLIYQNNDSIFDFSYKCLNDENTNIENYRTFFNVLFSFKLKNHIIIDSENFIVKKEETMNIKIYSF